MFLDAAAVCLPLAVWGAHALYPWRLARADESLRRAWALSALPLLLAAGAVALAATAARPDAAVALGLGGPLAGTRLGRTLAIAVLSGLAADALLLVSWRRLESAGWRLAGAIGWVGLAVTAAAGELLRAAAGPPPGLLALVVGAFTRLLIGLAAAEVGPGPNWYSTLAGVALPLSFLVLAPPLRRVLGAELDLLTFGAAAFLLVVARWLPPRFRRPAAFAGVVLAAIALARVAAAAGALPTLLVPTGPLPPT